MKFIRTRAWFIRYRESLTFGVLLGVLLTNVYILNQQIKTIDRVLDISKQIKESNQVTVDYVQCIALIHPDFRTEKVIQECVKNGVVPNTIRASNKSTDTPTASSQATVPTQSTPTEERQEPTTSMPPDKNVVERLGEKLTGISNKLETIVKEVL